MFNQIAQDGKGLGAQWNRLGVPPELFVAQVELKRGKG
jgi:hypothetical protein